MKPQYILLILFALFITGLADSMEAAFMGIGLIPGSIPVIGTAVAAVAEPLGIGIGLCVSWCINITMGAGLILFLLYEGMFYPQYLFPGVIAEIIPGINDLPFWVLVVVLCIIKKTGENPENAWSVVAATASAAASATLVGSSPARVFGAAKTLGTINQIRERQPQPESEEEAPEQPQRIPLNLKSPTINSDILPHAQAA